ncbi:MAG: hypothetical protein P4L50_12865 [Anaerolineaceae bacterium]|nr:hypothetical protein [Anaerolineaceae bacterium]
MKRIYYRILPAFIIFIGINLACQISVGGPKLPQTNIPISTQAAGSVGDIWKTAVLDTKSGTVSLTLSEEQLTSFLAAHLPAEQKSLFINPQIVLQDGQIQVYGQMKKSYFIANVQIIMQAYVDNNGQPKLSIISADFGPLPAPAGLMDSLSSIFNEAFTGSLGPYATGLKIESIDIKNGKMTITGKKE